jgi:ABC-type nitrate/sulfonate/bicarbonate transport system substrate-binding protein
MSIAGQQLLLATANYHVGHSISVRVAEAQGYCREEGFERYDFDPAGACPGPFERDALGLIMEERGIDIVLGARTTSILHQRSLGADLFIVGCWRLDGPAGSRWYGARHLKSLADARGARIGIRERGSMDQGFISAALLSAGVDPEREVEWIFDPIFYQDSPEAIEALESGRVDLAYFRPATWAEIERRGFPMLLDTFAAYPAGRPGRVIAATGRTIRERPDELRAFLRANLRGFWFCRNADNFQYLYALDAGLRLKSHNDVEHFGRLVTSPEDCSSWAMPLDGAVSPTELEKIVREQVDRGTLAPVAVADVLSDAPMTEAYRELCGRAELRTARDRNATLAATFGY